MFLSVTQYVKTACSAHSHTVRQDGMFSSQSHSTSRRHVQLTVTQYAKTACSAHSHTVRQDGMSAYLEIRRSSNICRYLTICATTPLVCAFVLSKLDYCNSLLSGAPKFLLDKLQRSKTLCSKLASKNMSNPSSKNVTGYQSAQESSTKF